MVGVEVNRALKHLIIWGAEIVARNRKGRNLTGLRRPGGGLEKIKEQMIKGQHAGCVKKKNGRRKQGQVVRKSRGYEVPY